MFKFILILLFSIQLSNSIFALEPILLEKNKEEYSIGKYLEILEDQTRTKTFEEIQKIDTKVWRKSKTDTPNIGHTISAYWFRANIDYPLDKEMEYFLEIAYPVLDKIDLYFLEEGNQNYSHLILGDKFLYKERIVSFYQFVFPLKLNPKSKYQIYIRIETQGNLLVPITIYNLNSFLKRVNSSMIAYGIYFGCILVMIFYNFFLYLSIRDRSYLQYVFYLMSFFILQAGVTGIGLAHIWSNYPIFNDGISIYSSLLGITILGFTSSFLRTKDFFPRMHRLTKISQWIFGISILLYFILGFSITIRLVLLLGLITILIAYSIGISVWRKGFKPAKYYFFAWSFFLFGGTLYILKTLSLLPSNFLTEYGAQIGSIFEFILLSLGLANRINLEKEARQKAEKLALENQHRAEKFKEELEARKRAIELEESRDRLSIIGQSTASIVHDLKNPIATIRAYTELSMGDEISETDRKEYLEMVLREIERLGDMAFEILDFTKTKINLSLTETNLNDFLEDIYKFLKLDFDYAGIDFKVKAEDTIILNIDRERIRRVLINLANNAREAMAERTNSQFSIQCFKDGNEIVLSVADNGNGLPDRVIENIFQAFVTEGKKNGTGLGLYMAKIILEAHGGKITYETGKSIGTTFYLRFPFC